MRSRCLSFSPPYTHSIPVSKDLIRQRSESLRRSERQRIEAVGRWKRGGVRGGEKEETITPSIKEFAIIFEGREGGSIHGKWTFLKYFGIPGRSHKTAQEIEKHGINDYVQNSTR